VLPLNRSSRRRWAEAVLVSAGLLLFATLIYAAGPAAILDQIRRLGWCTPLLILPYLAAYLVDSVGWWYVLTRGLPPEGRGAWRPPSLPEMFSIRAAGEAVNAVTPTAYLGGEPLKALLLRGRGVPLPAGMASALVSKTALMLSQGVFVFLGLLIALPVWYPAIPLAPAMAAGLGLVALAWRLLIGVQRRSPFTLLLALSRRWSGRRELLAGWEDEAATLDLLLKAFYDGRRREFLACCGLHFLGWVLGVLEPFVLLRLLGHPVDLGTVFAIEALAGVAKLAAVVVPASLGVQESGQLLIFVAFGLGAPLALAFSVIRRGRELLWIAYGLFALWRERRHGPRLERQGAKDARDT
jgi:putative membrane protein